MYYDFLEPDSAAIHSDDPPPTVLLIHGFGGTPESDFKGQLPALRGYCRVIAPQYQELMTTDDMSLVQTASRLGRTAGAAIPGPSKAVGTTFLPML